MKETLRILVHVVEILSFCGLMLAGMLGLLYEITGHARFVQILSSIGISQGFERTWILGAIMLLVLIVSHFVSIKLSTK